MKGQLSTFRWRFAGAATFCCALAFGLTALAEPERNTKISTPGNSASGDPELSGLLRSGTDLSKMGLRVMPPIVVDYRNDGFTVGKGDAAATAVGGGSGLPGNAAQGSVAGPVACRFNADCDDCNPCTLDACQPTSCADGPRMGYPCISAAECRGVCIGGDNDGDPCVSPTDCCSASPPDGVCEFFTCADAGADMCINWPIPEGEHEPDSECDDGLECNGPETCASNECVAGAPLCAADQWCRESADTCHQLCLSDLECNLDNDVCTNDLCDEKLCVNGENDGDPCREDADCPDGTCSGGGTGECFAGVPPCGPDGACTTGQAATCALGRCCDINKVCTAANYGTCNAAGGTWLAVSDQVGEDSACELTMAGNANVCPEYGSGIADQGVFTVEVGPISYQDCDIERLGDDYTLGNVSPTEYFNVAIVRIAAGVPRNARIALEFWTEDGQFIEDLFFPDGTNTGPSGPVIHTIELEPPLTVPATGRIAISVAREFGPNGALTWLATDAVDKGSNDAGKLFLNGADVTGYLGECAGGGRDGLWCDQTAVMADPDFYKVGCPSGACNGIAHVLAFELVGTESIGAPTGACCSPATGACTVELPWVCRAANGFFQGVGTSCNVCSNNPFVSCADNTDCDVCVGGANDGQDCVDDNQCPGGDCTSGECQTAPPACTINACCSTMDGTCVDAFGGTCTGEGMEPCINDGQCPEGQTCEPGCPVGHEGQGFGTSCEPNCCEQPTITGGDSCLVVQSGIRQIVIPAPGEDPVVETFTGNNSTATFDDWNTRICVGGTNDNGICNPDVGCPGGGVCNTGTLLCEGGTNDGNACNPNVGCPDGGECTGRLCNSGIFDPDGTADPGWSEGFELIGTFSSCANVRIQLCCTEVDSPTGPQPVRPAWGNLFLGCPCEAILGNTGVETPVGLGRGNQGFQRGGPFCPADDNLWGNFRLAPGQYFYPIYSAPQGTAAAPIVGGAGTDYQFSVIVAACPVAACCGRVCVSGSSAGELCNPEDVDPCPGGACGPATGCDVINEFDCADVNGFWLAGENLPVGQTDPNVFCGEPVCADASVPPDGTTECIGGPNSGQPCVTVANCGPAVCDIGTCCRGPGDCQDTFDGAGVCDPTNPVNCIDQNDCEEIFQPPGTFIGGATCDWVPPNGPCPICPIFADENCQNPDAIWYFSMDRAHPGTAADGGGVATAIADDFVVPAGQDQISQFCFQFLVGYSGAGGITPCVTGGFSEPDLETGWEIRFYASEDGLPGAELPGSPGPIAPAAFAPTTPGDNQYRISFVLDPPVEVQPGQRVWVEWSGEGNANVSGQSTCRLWFQTSHEEGNDFALTEGDPRSDWSIADNTFSNLDFGFCVSCGYETPPQPTGGCCECSSTCTNDLNQADCQGITEYSIGFPATTTALGPTINAPNGAEWYPDQACTLDFTCEDRGGGAACPGADPDVGEACATAQHLSVDGTYLISNSCSTRDGVGTYGPSGCDTPNPDATGPWTFEKDVWFTYTASCDGNVHIDTCSDNEFDVIAAVYVNQADPTVFPACYPPNSDLIPHGSGRCIENDCGKQPSSSFVRFGVTGEKYLIRIGSQDYTASADFVSAGRTSIDVFCEQSCFQASQPTIQPLVVGPTTFENRKGRHLAIRAGDAGRQQAIRVSLFDLPAPHSIHEGRQLFVGQPRRLCENSGQVAAPQPTNPPNFGCSPSSAGPRSAWFANLQETPFYYDWNGTCPAGTCVQGMRANESCVTDTDCRGTVNIFSPVIVPSSFTVTGTYDVQVLDSSCSDIQDNASYSVVRRVTVPRWGDILSNNGTTPPGPPNNIVDGGDIVGVLNKFKNLAASPEKARADIEPLCADHLILGSDITRVLDAFGNDPFPFTPATFPLPVCP